MDIFSRTELILGKNNMQILQDSSVAVFGLGGVGSFVTESLARCGIGNISIIDNDVVDKTNINRQLCAYTNTIGLPKTNVIANRLKLINPKINLTEIKIFVTPENTEEIINPAWDYIVDAIDNVPAKLAIIKTAHKFSIPIISCMGTGNKIHPELLKIDDIKKTTMCPLARVIRKELKNSFPLKVCYSTEQSIKNSANSNCIGSVSFVPSIAGLMIGGEVIRDILKIS